MAMTELSVLFMLTVATLASIGLFAPTRDPTLPVLAGFVASVLWAVGGLSAFSVYSEAYQGTQPMTPLAVVAIGLSVASAALAFYKLRNPISEYAGTEADSFDSIK